MVIFCKKASLLALLSLKTIKNGVKFCVYLIFTFKCNYDKITVVNHKFQNIKRRMVMKKFLAVVSLMLVALMVIAIPAVSAADETMDKPEGINIFYATDVSGNEPSIDGTISEGEYGEGTRLTTYKALKNSDWGGSWETGSFDETLASEYIDVYFAYDEEYIYFAFYELGAPYVDNGDEFDTNDVPFRNNYRFRFGLELDNMLNYFQTDSGWTNAWQSISPFFAGSRQDQSAVKFSDFSEALVAKYNVDTGAYVAFGDLVSANGNTNYTGGQWALVVEWKFDKAGFAEAWNAIYATEYDHMSNAMWVEMTTSAFRAKKNNLDDSENQYFRWLGQNDITGKGSDYADYGVKATSTSMFDLVVFGTEEDDLILADPFPPETTEAPTTEEPTTEPATEESTTEAPTTEPATEAPVTEAPTTEAPATEEATTEAPATEAPTTEAPKTEAPTTEAPAEEEGGCGSTIGVAGLALVAALGTCTVFVSKKRD